MYSQALHSQANIWPYCLFHKFALFMYLVQIMSKTNSLQKIGLCSFWAKTRQLKVAWKIEGEGLRNWILQVLGIKDANWDGGWDQGLVKGIGKQ